MGNACYFIACMFVGLLFPCSAWFSARPCLFAGGRGHTLESPEFLPPKENSVPIGLVVDFKMRQILTLTVVLACFTQYNRRDRCKNG